MSEIHCLRHGQNTTRGSAVCGFEYDDHVYFSYNWYETVVGGSPYSFSYCYKCLKVILKELRNSVCWDKEHRKKIREIMYQIRKCAKEKRGGEDYK